MTYRILCDENVEPQTVHHLEHERHEAMHVGDALSLSVNDGEIATYARENDYAVLTNDTDFLDSAKFPDITVLLYTNNRASAHELTAMIAKLTNYYPTQNDLPDEFYLSEENI